MNTQQLECFVCVADKLNFTRAAEELFLSTPTVTHHIKSLEEELGAKLFYRNSKIVKLTEIGYLFYNDAKEILGRIDVSQKKISNTIKQDISFIRIGCSSFAELDRLHDILKIMREEFPNTYPQIYLEDYFKLKTMFEDRHIDVLFATREMVKGVNCLFKKLKEISSFAIFSEDLPLSSKKELSFEDLRSTCLITMNPKFIPFQRGNSLQEEMLIHSQDRFNLVCENEQTSIVLAKAGYGVAILPEHVIPEVEGVAIRPIQGQSKIEYGIVYHKKIKEVYIRHFIDKFEI